MTNLGKCIQNFNDADNLMKAWQDFYTSHCPYRDLKSANLTYHWQVRHREVPCDVCHGVAHNFTSANFEVVKLDDG